MPLLHDATGEPGRSARHSLHVRLNRPLFGALRDYAERNGLGLSSAIRALASQALRDLESRGEKTTPEESSVSLSALVAAEHAVLMVASVLPEGERRRRELGALAIQAAEDRLDALDGQAGDL